ncbi:hypothetical protein PFFVO_02983 [Plasmodium falciparum Vietnam Oak-Knoll (FVO)]|uniref:Uncharacterized protein n=1 Tax=Plasmodium falciparum Vietnam Oak-Knoll (FVO) TaxID=1036723 RepID=A0A024V7B1_PLAFA|nr:hypothetical protein PFFVO_02983 [Plasmodium falciparum Vietnam Oak-Knoll (FVO)]
MKTNIYTLHSTHCGINSCYGYVGLKSKELDIQEYVKNKKLKNKDIFIELIEEENEEDNNINDDDNNKNDDDNNKYDDDNNKNDDDNNKYLKI